jgi:ADP-ribose pyrophosphatase
MSSIFAFFIPSVYHPLIMPVPPPLDAKKVFDGLLATVYQWPQKMYDDSTRTFECYIRPDTVTVIPFLDRETVLMTKQMQPGRPEPFWDVPGGRADPGETLEEAAIREFREETGYRAGRMVPIIHRKHNGLIRYETAIYLATDLTRDPIGNHEDDGEKIEVVPTHWNDVLAMCYQKMMRQPEVMLTFLCMEHHPDDRAKLDAFLSATEKKP